MRFFLRVPLLVFFAFAAVAQVDSVESGYDTVIVTEEPIVVDLGHHNVVEDKYSSFYLSAFFTASYDFNWYRNVPGYEYYLDKLRQVNAFNYSRGFGIGGYYLPQKHGKRVWNANLFYSRYYELFWYQARQPTTNMFDFVGAELKRGVWIRRDKRVFSMIAMLGYGIEYKAHEKGITYQLDVTIEDKVPIKDLGRYRTIQNYASFSVMMIFRMNRFKWGIEPYFFCHLRNFTTHYQPFKQVLMQGGLRTNLIFCY